MTISKNITAFDQLYTFATDKWDKVGVLCKHILDHHLEDSFESFITLDVFPNGADEDEFMKYCCENVDEIMRNI